MDILIQMFGLFLFPIAAHSFVIKGINMLFFAKSKEFGIDDRLSGLSNQEVTTDNKDLIKLKIGFKDSLYLFIFRNFMLNRA